MNSASMLTGLLNANGVKGRLAESAGKSGPVLVGSRRFEEWHEENGLPQSDFLTQIDKSGDKPRLAMIDLNREKADLEDVGGEPAEAGEADTVPQVADDATAEDAAKEASADVSVSLQVGFADDRVQIATEIGDRTGLANTIQAEPAALGAPPAESKPNELLHPALRADIAGNANADRSVGPVFGNENQAPRVNVQLPVLPAQALNRYGGNDRAQKPAGPDDVHSMRSSLENLVVKESAAAKLASTETPSVVMSNYRMASATVGYPVDFLDKFSRQLDGLRPAFRDLPAGDGQTRASMAGTQGTVLPTGSLPVGTVPQVQQAIQAAMVNLARETSAATQTTRTLELSLVPRSLGEIRVHVVKGDNRISVEIVTHSAAATHAMENAKSDIIRGYLQFGIQPEEVSIRIAEARESQQPSLSAGQDNNRGDQELARNGQSRSEQPSTPPQEEQASSSEEAETRRNVEVSNPRIGLPGKIRYF